MNFQFLHLKFTISTKSASEAAILRSENLEAIELVKTDKLCECRKCENVVKN